jgi:hypothetical protein
MKRRTALDAGAEKVAGRSRSDKGPAKKRGLLNERQGPASDLLVDETMSGPTRALAFVMAMQRQATCYVFGNDLPGSHLSERFYFVRLSPEILTPEKAPRQFAIPSVWAIRRAPEDHDGAWSRMGGGIWLALAKCRDEKDPDAVRWTFADGWVECERILREGIHEPGWQKERVRVLRAAERPANESCDPAGAMSPKPGHADWHDPIDPHDLGPLSDERRTP